MFEQLAQYGDAGLLVLRIAVAVIFIYHAIPKLRSAKGMASGMGAPTGAIFLLGAVEFLSSIGLLFISTVQISAILLGVVMLGAIYFKTQKWHVPFFAMDKTGWEFDFALLAALIAILLTGGGAMGIL